MQRNWKSIDIQTSAGETSDLPSSELHHRISCSHHWKTEAPELNLRLSSSLQSAVAAAGSGTGTVPPAFYMSRAPNHEFQEWWNKQRERNHDLFSAAFDEDPSTSGNANGDFGIAGGAGGGNGYHAVEIRGQSSDPTVEKSRARSARQIRFFCFLKLQQIASSFASLAGASLSVLRTANRRIVASPADSPSSRLYRIIRFFLILVVVLLGFELLAYYKGWHFSRPRPSVGSKELLDWLGLVYAWWLDIRAKYLAPPLQSLANVCIVLFLIQSVDRAVLVLGCFWIKFRGIKPVANVEYGKEGLENGIAEEYPMVLVQIPMCNEREVRTSKMYTGNFLWEEFIFSLSAVFRLCFSPPFPNVLLSL